MHAWDIKSKRTKKSSPLSCPESPTALLCVYTLLREEGGRRRGIGGGAGGRRERGREARLRRHPVGI